MWPLYTIVQKLLFDTWHNVIGFKCPDPSCIFMCDDLRVWITLHYGSFLFQSCWIMWCWFRSHMNGLGFFLMRCQPHWLGVRGMVPRWVLVALPRNGVRFWGCWRTLLLWRLDLDRCFVTTEWSSNKSEKRSCFQHGWYGSNIAAPAHVIFCAWDPAENMTCPLHTESHTVHGWMTLFESNISLSSAIDCGIPVISFNIHGCGAIWQLSPILSFCLKSMYCTLFFHSYQDLHSRALEQTAVSGTQQDYVGEKPCQNLCFLIGAEWSQCFKLKVRTNKFVTRRRSLVNTKVVTSLAINACIKQYRYQETLELLHRLPHNLFGEKINRYIYDI